MIYTKHKHHEELQLLPQIAGYCYVAMSLAIGAVIGVIKDKQQPKDKDHEND